MRKNYVRIGLLLLAVGFLGFHFRDRLFADRYVYDEADLLQAGDEKRFDAYLDSIFEESDVDIKLVFLKTANPQSLEAAAEAKMGELGIGGRGRQERGILLLYALDKKRLRVEVGYGLEEYFPDAFVGYLMREHARGFFAASNPSMGVRFLVRMLQYRIRSAILGESYDPRVLEEPRAFIHLSGGAGVTDAIDAPSAASHYKRDFLDPQAKDYFSGQPTVEGTYQKYLAWLYAKKYDPSVPLFTADTYPILHNFPMSEAYFDYILMQEAGKAYKIEQRGNLALMYFTDDPLVTPHLFKRVDGKWLLDIAAEIRNAKEAVGGPYTWFFRGSKDEYTRVFRDKLIQVGNVYRIEGGDNRPLPVRGQ